jgi:hypothetical protein
MENIRLFMKNVIEKDKEFGAWASQQDLTAMAEGWGDNMQRIEEPKRMSQYFQVLEHLFNTGCQQDWKKLSEELEEDLFKAEVYSDYRTDELLCVLHAFTMIMQQDWTHDEKWEQFCLLSKHWKFLKYYYSIMIRHIVGVKYTRWTDVTDTVMKSSSSFFPHLHIYYCGLTERIGSLGLDFKQFKKLDDMRMKMLAVVNSHEPSEALYTLCDALFPADFQRMLNTHRPKSYKEIEDESNQKDELIQQLRDHTSRTCQELDRSKSIIEQMVLSSIPIEDIDAELEQYPPGTAWDMLKDLNANPIVSMQKAWREHYPELFKKYRERLFGPIEQQRNVAEAIMKVAEEPRMQINNTLELVNKKETNIDKNYGPNIEHNGGTLTMPEGNVATALPKSDDDK